MTPQFKTQAERREELLAMQQESTLLVRELLIQETGVVDKTTKSGRLMKFMTWKYLNPDYEDWEWKERQAPLFKPESRLIIENGPYEEDCRYKVTAVQDDKGFWTWISIEKIENNNEQEVDRDVA